MNFYDQLLRIERLDIMFRTRSTGPPEELARKLKISPSQLYQVLNIMRKRMGAPIYYSRAYQSYCYGKSVQFICAFKEVKQLAE